MTPVQIRDALIARKFPHTDSKNLLISVHTVLSRIESELDVIARDGKQAYRIMNISLADLAFPSLSTMESLVRAAKDAQKIEAKKRQRGITPPPQVDDVK